MVLLLQGGFQLLDVIEECRDLLEQFGGHSQAAGMAIQTIHLDKLRARLVAVVNRELKTEQLSRDFKIDATLRLSEITSSLMEELYSLEPFGRGNGQPIF